MAPKRKPATRSNSEKAGTIFPVGRINKMIKEGRYSEKVGSSAGIFMTAVLEYLAADILATAGDICAEQGKTAITPQHLNMVLKEDTELSTLIALASTTNGGVIQNINDFLLPSNE